MFFRYLVAKAHMGVIGIRARFKILLAARSVMLIAFLVLLLAAFFTRVIIGLPVKSIRAALLAGAFCYAVEIYKVLQRD